MFRKILAVKRAEVEQTTGFEKIKKQVGLTLIEALATLLIICVFIGGTLAYFSSTMSTNTSTQLIRDVTALRALVNSLYMGQGNYGNSSLNQTLITAGKIPTNMKTNGNNITTSGGSSVIITGNGTNFTISIDRLTTDVCVPLLTGLSDGWQSVSVNGTTFTNFPITPAQATSSSACSRSNNNTIIWTSRS